MPTIPSMPSVANIFRPFNGNQVGQTACRVVPSLRNGTGYFAGGNYLVWTHRIDIPAGVDVRDGCGRTGGLDFIVFADGDGLRVLSGTVTSTFVVVWVEQRYIDTAFHYQRAYCLRDTVSP